MVKFWNELGFIVPRKTPTGEKFFVETERNSYAGINVREYFYYMMNIESNLDFIPKPRILANQFI